MKSNITSFGRKLERKQDVALGGGREQKVNFFQKYVKFYCGSAVWKLFYLKLITDRDLGAVPPAAGGYGQFF